MKNDPIEQILREIGEFLQMAESHAGIPITKPIPPEVEQQLNFLENAVLQFKEKLSKEAASSGINPSELQAGAFRMPEGLTKKQQETWEKAAKLRWDLEGMRYILNDVMAKSKEPYIVQKSPKGKKRAVIQRRSKFKKMGGDKWKKM
jgi:hypothetical protein